MPYRKYQKASPSFGRTLAEEIEQQVITAIMQGKFKPGQRLIENDLVRDFGTSRSPIREAFRSLMQSGLLVVLPRRGTFVRNVDEKDIQDKFPVRAYLEGFAAKLAIQRMGPDDIREMDQAFSRMEKSAAKKDFKAYTEHHNTFHMVFINACGNDALISLLKTLRRDILWLRFSYLLHEEDYKHTLPVHRKIIECFMAKDEKNVETLIRDHIMEYMGRFTRFLASRDSRTASGSH